MDLRNPQLRRESVAIDPPSLTFVMPDGRPLEAKRERSTRSELGLSWVATLWDADHKVGRAHLVVHDQGVSAVLEVDGRGYELHTTASGEGRLVEPQRTAWRACGVDAEVAAGPSVTTPPGGPDPLPLPTDPEAVPVLDVAVLYTEEFLGNEQSVRDFIDTSIALANDVFANSGVAASYRLVYKGPLTGAQPPVGTVVPISGIQYEQREEVALSWLNGEPAEVAEVRNASGADIVVLFIPSPQAPVQPYACGFANRQGANGLLGATVEPFNGRAFSVQRNNCGLGDYTFAHELGHNYGMFHRTADMPGQNPRYTFGAGTSYTVNQQPQATAMFSELCVGTASPAAICRRTPYFSSPLIFVGGVPVGDTTHDNARVAQLETPNYAALRPTAPGTVPSVRIASPARHATLTAGPVVLQGSASDVEDGTLNAQLRWTLDGQSFLGTGPSLTVTLSPGAHMLTARATDSSGQEGQWSVPVIVQTAPPVASFTFQCTGLQCNFNGSSSTGASALTYTWTFPGNQTATGASQSFFMPGAGFFAVTLTVRDTTGATNTRSTTVSVAPARVALHPGAWFNPARSGAGIDFFATPDGGNMLIWYSYLGDGTPTWYISGVSTISNGDWVSPLYRSTWNGSSNTVTQVGSVRMTASSTTEAWFSWTLNGVAGGEHFVYFFGGGGRTGAWFEPALSGWGIELDESGSTLLATVAFYQGSEPRWAQGSATSSADTTMSLLWFTGPGLCPGCTYVGPPTARSAGTLNLRIASPFDGAGFATTAITSPSGATWNRDGVSIAKLTP